MKIWILTETILMYDEREQGHTNYYTTKEKALEALHDYLLDYLEEEEITNGTIQRTYPDGSIRITTTCNYKHGMYECEYNIDEFELDHEFEY